MGECSGERMRMRESEGERQGGAWRPGEASRASRKESGNQEVARRVPACGGHTPRVLLARGGGRLVDGPGGLLQCQAGQVRPR